MGLKNNRKSIATKRKWVCLEQYELEIHSRKGAVKNAGLELGKEV